MSGRVPAGTERDLGRIVNAVRELFAGRCNAFGTVTLTASAASTAVTAPNIADGSPIFLEATTAHAAAERGNGTIYVSAVSAGTFTITHANNAQTDRTFFWRIGG